VDPVFVRKDFPLEGGGDFFVSAPLTTLTQDEAAGDLLQIQDGLMTFRANKGPNAAKPRLTIIGAEDSVPRITLVSKQGEDAKHVSLYNRYGKFGVFSGVLDTSIFHINADGSEVTHCNSYVA